jgi:hypothetical protein
MSTTTTTTLARTLADAYETAQTDRAKADGAYLTVAMSWHRALTEGAVTYGALVKATPSLKNVREAQRVALLGESIAEHGMPEGIDPGDVATVEAAIGTILGHYGRGAVEAVREAIAEGDDITEAWEAILALRAEVTRRRKAEKPATEAPETTEAEGAETAPEAPKARGNGALIADALANIERVDPETLTEAETLALASLIQAVAALGKAYQTRQAAA